MRFKINKILTASLFACMLMGGFLFNSCKTEEPDSTAIKLNAFGPSPALRGGDLKFIGTNMDKVTSVVLPGNEEITEITKTGTTEISISVPQDAKPGTLTLKTPQGDIVTKTPLTFTEPILITSFSPATVKAGDVLTINGDYLNLIKQVIFSDGVVADSTAFGTQTRKQLTVTVPAEAKTGKVAISNGAAIPVLVYTASELQVTLPAITALAPNPVKAGTALQITGTNFQLVKSIIFTDGLTVTNFTLNADKTGITVTVPATAKDGKVTLVAKSGVQVQSASPLTLVAPTITSVAPNPAKNGATLTVTGTDLDLVTGATFGGAVAGTISTQSATSLVLTVPLTAVDGPVVLSTNSGKTVSSAAITYVKPTITSIAPLALTAGGKITITGTNLDLVSKVNFIGGLSVDVTPTSATSFDVIVPPACVGKATITLVTTNGSQVVSTDQVDVAAANKPVITGITSSVKPGGLLVITGTKLNLVESIVFQTNQKAVLYGVRTATSIEVYVPQTAKNGVVTLTMNAFDGSAIVSPVFSISGTDPVTDPSLVIFDFEDRNGNNSANNAGGWGGIANGKSTANDGVSGSFFEITASNWNSGAYWWVADNWVEAPYPTISGINNYVIKMDVRLRQDIPVDDQVQISLLISNKTAINFIPYLPVVNNKYSTGGEWITISIPTTSLTDPTLASGDWGIVKGWNPNNVNFTGFCVDNIRYDLKSKPSSIRGLY